MGIPDRLKKTTDYMGMLFIVSAPWSLIGMQFSALAGLATASLLAFKSGGCKSNKIDIAVLIYLCTLIFSFIASPDMSFDPLRSTSFWTVSAFALFRVGSSPWRVSAGFFNSLAIALLIVCLYSILQAFFGFDIMRPSEPLSYPNPGGVGRFAVFGFFDRHHTFAASIGMLTLFCISVLLQNDGMLKRLLLSLLTFAAALALFLAQSRALFVALPFALLPLLYLGAPKKRLLPVLAIMLLLPAILLIFSNSTAGKRLLHPLENDDARIKIMHTAATAQSERPLSGWGYGRFYLVADSYFDALHTDVHVRSGTHNDLLQMLFDGGLPLAFAYLLLAAAIFGTALNLMRKNSESGEIAGIFSAMLIFFIYSLFHNALADGEVSLLFWALAGYLAGLDAEFSKSK